MRLPNSHNVIIPEAKIKEYLLSTSHSYGRYKAAFFQGFGFNIESWETMALALRVHAEQCEVTLVEQNEFGVRYVVEGPLLTPDGRAPIVRVVR